MKIKTKILNQEIIWNCANLMTNLLLTHLTRKNKLRKLAKFSFCFNFYEFWNKNERYFKIKNDFGKFMVVAITRPGNNLL